MKKKGKKALKVIGMSAVDPKQMRFVFQKIFEVLHQEQHYRYMLGTTDVA